MNRVEKDHLESSKSAAGIEQKNSADRLELVSLQSSELLLQDASIAGPSGFLDGVTDGAIRQPIRALAQLAGQPLEQEGAQRKAQESSSQKVGHIVGSILPFVAAGIATKSISSRLFGETANPSVYRTMAEQGSSGFIVGSVLSTSELKPGESLLTARLKQGGINAATFATMAGASGLLEKSLPKFGNTLTAELTRRVSIGGLSGAVAGLADAEFKTGFNASKEELFTSALGFAAFGSLMEGGGTLAKAYLQRSANNLVQSGNAEKYLAGTTSSEARLRGSSAAENELVLRKLAADPHTTIVSSPAGWYDKLSSAIYKAPKDHTIIVTDSKWLAEGQKILKSAKRTDINLVIDVQAGSRMPADKSAAMGAGVTKTESKIAEPFSEVINPKSMDHAARARLTDNIRKEFAQNGVDPAKAIGDALKKGRVVMVGEYHVDNSAHRVLGAEMMPELKKAGLTHLAIEHSKSFQGKIFLPDGTVDHKSLPELLQHREFYSLLAAAKREKIEVVPIDTASNTARDLLSRNKVMDAEIGKLLENPKNKVLYWVGNKHLQMQDATGEGAQVAKMLRDRGVPVTTFYGSHDNFWREEPLRNLFTPNIVKAVPTENSPSFRGLSWLHPDQTGHNVHKYSEFDFVILHPQQRNLSFD